MTWGIPTKYKTVQFRSRLEAKWAALFDLLEWEWEYEPIDAKGYIPDFWITPLKCFAEVKPLTDYTDGEYQEAAVKLREAGIKGRAIILGSVARDSPGALWCGLASDGDSCWYDFQILRCTSCRAFSTSMAKGQPCWRCDQIGPWPEQNETLKTLWIKAGNTVQWRPHRASSFGGTKQRR